MVARAALLLLAVLVASCQCGFDAGKLDVLRCSTAADCRPDQDCIEQICTQRRCDDVMDCGGVALFECRAGFCEALSIGDGGVDAAAPCTGPAECADGLNCTEDDCQEGFCVHAVRDGSCAIDAACWQGGDANPANTCQVCRPAESATHWTADDARAPNDGIDCTIDRCSGGQPLFEPQDGLCGDGICSRCAGGCVPRPVLTVDCPDRPGVAGGGPSSCTVTASPAPLADDGCLSCGTVVGLTSLVRDDFEGCPSLSDLGWLGDIRGVRCSGPEDLGPDVNRGEGQIGLNDSRATLERWVNTTGFDSVRLCFDIASNDEDREPLMVELDASGAWMSVWSGGVPPGGRLVWQNVCLDLVALDPLAAGNPSVGVRFRPIEGLWGPEIYLDNVVIDAWVSRTIERPGRLFSDDFAECALASWTVEGDAPTCPVVTGNLVAIDAAGATDSSWTLSRVLDLTDRDDVRVGFSLLSHEADSNEIFRALVDHGSGLEPVWALERGPTPDDVVARFEAPLSHIDPDVRFQPAVTLSIQAEAGGFADLLVVDDVWLDAAVCQPAEDIVSASGPAPLDPGTWTVDVLGTARTTAALRCTWDGRADLVGHDTVQFCPDAECTPHERESQSCGECGTQERRCGDDCRWLDWSSCADQPCSCCDEYGANCVSCCC